MQDKDLALRQKAWVVGRLPACSPHLLTGREVVRKDGTARASAPGRAGSEGRAAADLA